MKIIILQRDLLLEESFNANIQILFILQSSIFQMYYRITAILGTTYVFKSFFNIKFNKNSFRLKISIENLKHGSIAIAQDVNADIVDTISNKFI
jgi:hypothetical protein